MDPYILLLGGFGAVVLLTAWLPMLLKDLPLSLPLVCVALGAALFLLPGAPGAAPDPADYVEITKRLTEFVLIVALMGAGLKLDRPLGWRSWMTTWRLLGVSMPLTIGAIAFLGWWLLGLGWPTAVLLGAVLAPTDPVLASDVQVGPPRSGGEDEARFALTSEAGLNDGLAFPFVRLAIALSAAAATGEPWAAKWLLVDVAWALGAAIAIGWLFGRAMAYLTFRLPARTSLSRTGDGFVALGVTCLAYALTNLAHGYGFVAVFLAALALRNAEREHEYHDRLHDFAEQTERLFMMVLLVLFGGALAGGGLLNALDWRVVAFAALCLFLVRPLSGWIGLAGLPFPAREKAVISFFGIRGVGSVYFLAYALGEAEFERPDMLWTTLSVVVLVSIVLHGVTVTPAMRRLDRKRDSDRSAPAGK